MAKDAAVALEEGVQTLSSKRLGMIEERLSGVEGTLEQLLADGQETKQEMKEKLSEIQIEIERGASQVRSMRRKLYSSQSNSKWLFIAVILVMVAWTVIMNWMKVETL